METFKIILVYDSYNNCIMDIQNRNLKEVDLKLRRVGWQVRGEGEGERVV